MKTKPPEPIPTAFPTCGEVFHYLVAALDLTAWADAFPDPDGGANTKRRDVSEIKDLSDQLRDWAAETEGRAPGRDEMEDFIRCQVKGLPRADELEFVLITLWQRVLEQHTCDVNENATFLGRHDTREWCARWWAPGRLFFLWVMQNQLQRLAQSPGPMLDTPLNDLLARAWPEATQADVTPEHPLHRDCYAHYASRRGEGPSTIDPRTLAAWKRGEDRPSFAALGRHFEALPDKLGLVLNFAFAGLLEALANTMRSWMKPEDWTECRRLLLEQARCVHSLDDRVAKAVAKEPPMTLPDFECLLSLCLRDYMVFLEKLARSGNDSLDLRVARFRVYEEYQHRIASPPMPPDSGEFVETLDRLWRGTNLTSARFTASEVQVALVDLRACRPAWCEALAGPLLAVEARLQLRREPATSESLQTAFELYRQAFSASCYQAGSYTARVAREALGLGAMLHRRGVGEGSIKPWIKKVLEWWDLLGLGDEFDHEQLDQRIELAESRFTDRLHDELRTRLRAAMPELGLRHSNLGAMIGFSEPGLVGQLLATPVDRRQKKPMNTTIVGREQTPLMEAIDRGQLALAADLVEKGANLNFINSTGDTCLTKAFARSAYPLVLQILRRDHEPIRRETILRVTLKKRISGLEQVISHGQVEMLREVVRTKPGRGAPIDLNVEKLWDKTPLYYAITCLSHFRMSPPEAAQFRSEHPPQWLARMPRRELLEAVHKCVAAEANTEGILQCIEYMVTNVQVELDTPNVQGHSALTYAAERQLLDVTELLLKAGANVNHRFAGNGTALVWAVLKDDEKLAELLLRYGADYRLKVAQGRPIYMMPMSEKLRELIPARL